MTPAAPEGERPQFMPLPQRRRLGQLLTLLAGLCTAIALTALAAILLSLLAQGLPRLDGAALTQLPPPPLVPGGGLRNAIAGTLVMLAIATLISVPVGLLVAVYLAEADAAPATERAIAAAARFGARVLSGVPSIIAGLFVYGVVVLASGGFSAIAGGIALAVLMLPTVALSTEEGLRLVPQDVRWAAFAVGSTRLQAVTQVVLPAALPAIASGIVLAVARAAGETAPLLFTALFSQFDLRQLQQPTASLAVLIYNFALSPYPNQNQLAWVAALLILAGILGLRAIAAGLSRR